MKVLKIVVDELPSSCRSCLFSHHGPIAGVHNDICLALNKKLLRMIKKEECPLEKKEKERYVNM